MENKAAGFAGRPGCADPPSSKAQRVECDPAWAFVLLLSTRLYKAYRPSFNQLNKKEPGETPDPFNSAIAI